MLDSILLAVIAINTSVLVFRAVRKISKKSHFKVMLERNKRDLWSLEFQKEKLKAVREGIRQQYDRLAENASQAVNRLEAERAKPKKERDKATIESLESTVEKYAPDMEYMKKQLEGLDAEIEGEQNPQSVQAKIEGHHSLTAMLKEFIKRI